MSKGVVFISSVPSRRLNKAQQHLDSCVAKIYLRMVMFTLKNRQQYSIHTDSRLILKDVELNFPSPEANKKELACSSY